MGALRGTHYSDVNVHPTGAHMGHPTGAPLMGALMGTHMGGL